MLQSETSCEHSGRCENNPGACLHRLGSMWSDQGATSKPHPKLMWDEKQASEALRQLPMLEAKGSNWSLQVPQLDLLYPHLPATT